MFVLPRTNYRKFIVLVVLRRFCIPSNTE